jgi:hypothetical protein
MSLAFASSPRWLRRVPSTPANYGLFLTGLSKIWRCLTLPSPKAAAMVSLERAGLGAWVQPVVQAESAASVASPVAASVVAQAPGWAAVVAVVMPGCQTPRVLNRMFASVERVAEQAESAALVAPLVS